MSGRLIVYDAGERDAGDFARGFGADDALFSATPPVKTCVGCFGCWVKTPGRCVIADRAVDIPALFARSDEVVVVSPLAWGGYSRNVKAVLDRSIGYLLPFFRTVDGEMHHRMRHGNAFAFAVHFYGEGAPTVRENARRLVEANAVNLGARSVDVRFHEGIAAAKEAVL